MAEELGWAEGCISGRRQSGELIVGEEKSISLAQRRSVGVSKRARSGGKAKRSKQAGQSRAVRRSAEKATQ